MFKSRNLVNSEVLSNLHVLLQTVDKYSSSFDAPTLKLLVVEGFKCMVPLTKLKASTFAGGRVPDQIFTKPNHAKIKLLLTQMTDSVLYLASVEAGGEPVVKSAPTRKGKGKGGKGRGGRGGKTQVADAGAP
eukprot:737047-Alexandrium_andersonii.AAC.1